MAAMKVFPPALPGTIWGKATVNTDAVPAADALDVEFDAKGAKVGQRVILFMQDLEAKLGVCNAHIVTKDKIKFRLVNPSAAPIDPASQEVHFFVF